MLAESTCLKCNKMFDLETQSTICPHDDTSINIGSLELKFYKITAISEIKTCIAIRAKTKENALEKFISAKYHRGYLHNADVQYEVEEIKNV